MRLLLLSFLLIGIVFINNALGQTCCSGGAALAGNTVLTNSGKGNFQFSLLYDFNHINNLVQDNQIIGSNSLQRNISTFLIQTNYGITRNIGISLSIPIMYLSQTASGAQNKVDNFDISDIIISPQLFLLNNQFNHLQLGLGLKIPTGTTSKKISGSEIIMTPTLQTGTGSFDYIFHGLYNQSFEFRRSFSFQGLVSYRINTESRGLGGHDRYQYGNELFSLFALSDQFVVKRSIITPTVGVIYRVSSKNRIEGFDDFNSGGQWIYLRPGVGFTRNNVSFSLLTELPLWWDLNGLQLTTTYKIIAALSLTLSK